MRVSACEDPPRRAGPPLQLRARKAGGRPRLAFVILFGLQLGCLGTVVWWLRSYWGWNSD